MNEQLMMLLSQLTGGGSKGMVRDVGESKSIDDIIIEKIRKGKEQWMINYLH